jgi:hypothetical protein
VTRLKLKDNVNYRSEMQVKINEINRFPHKSLGTLQTTRTAAMKLGLAGGRGYPRDLFGE